MKSTTYLVGRVELIWTSVDQAFGDIRPGNSHIAFFSMRLLGIQLGYGKSRLQNLSTSFLPPYTDAFRFFLSHILLFGNRSDFRYWFLSSRELTLHQSLPLFKFAYKDRLTLNRLSDLVLTYFPILASGKALIPPTSPQSIISISLLLFSGANDFTESPRVPHMPTTLPPKHPISPT